MKQPPGWPVNLHLQLIDRRPAAAGLFWSPLFLIFGYREFGFWKVIAGPCL
jgi:hypothetical protein